MWQVKLRCPNAILRASVRQRSRPAQLNYLLGLCPRQSAHGLLIHVESHGGQPCSLKC